MAGRERHYTTNIQKGLIGSTASLLMEWLPGEAIDRFLERVSAENLLGNPGPPR